MEDNYSKAYKEVIEILNFVPKESVEKIPKEMIETFKAKMDKDYEFTVDVNKSFEEQNLLEETKALFAIIFRDYWATPYQRERILAKEKYDRTMLEKEKMEKYNPDDIFKNRQTKMQEELEKIENYDKSLPVEVKKENFFKKITDFFRKLFHIG